MQEISTITLGVALLAFLLGAVIVGIAAQSRSRRQQEAHAEQVRRLREEERKRALTLESAQKTVGETEQRLQDAQRTIEANTRESEILRAQFAEEQEASYGLEDRLNAAEARVLSVEAELAQNRAQLQRWHAAYGQLRDSHLRLADAHHQARTRSDDLARELETGRGELGALQSRLDALQTALASALRAPLALTADETGTAALIPAQIHEIALAKAEVQAVLRQRESELTELRGQLAATRFSLNILSASGAELASQIASMHSAYEGEVDEVAAPLPRMLSVNSVEAQQEQLANLEGMIADWFVDLRSDIPYTASMLRRFGGESAAVRYKDAPGQIEAASLGAEENSLAAPDAETLRAWLVETESGGVVSESSVSPDVMLAAIKAASMSALRRSRARQNELTAELAEAQHQLDEMKKTAALQSILVVEEVADLANLDGFEPEENPEAVSDDVEVAQEDAGDALVSSRASSGGYGTAIAESAGVAPVAPARPSIPSGIPRADIPMPATPRPTVPVPAAPGPAAEQSRNTPPLRTAWGRFVRRVETVLQRPSGRTQ